MNISWSHNAVMLGWMMFGMVVCIIVYAFVPEEKELLLCQAISQPIVPHVPRFGAPLMNIVVYETVGYSIVCFDGGGWLWMT